MTVAELPRLCYLGIDLACRHAQQHVDMLSSLLRPSPPSCHLLSATQLPGDSSHCLRQIRVPGKKASDAALVSVSLVVQGCMAAVGFAVHAVGAAVHLYKHSGGMP